MNKRNTFKYMNIILGCFLFNLLTITQLFAQENTLEQEGLSEGLRGYFSFDSEICNYGDGKDLTGTFVGTSTIAAQSKYSSGALSLANGENTNGHMVFENENRYPFILNNEEEITVALWIKPAKADNTRQNVVRVEGGGVTYFLEIASDNNFNSFISTVNPEVSNNFGNAFARSRGYTLSEDKLNKWYHVAFTFDGLVTKIYINGELNRSVNVNTPGFITVPWDHRKLYLGSLDNGNGQFKGLIDELYLYNKALTAEDISTLMQLEDPLASTAPPVIDMGLNIENSTLSDSLRGYFSFDSDSVDFGKGSTIKGALMGNATITDQSKYSQGALSLTQSSQQTDYLFFENSTPFILENEPEMTVALWVNPSKADGTQQNIVKVENGGLTYMLEIASDNNFNSFISTVNPENSGQYGNAFARVSGNKLTTENLNQWYHVAFTYDGDSTRIYLNGELNNAVKVNTEGYVVVPWTNRKLYLGSESSEGKKFEGQLDELYIYNRRLSDAEIHELMVLEDPLGNYSPTYNLVFDHNDGLQSTMASASFENNYTVVLPEPSRIGYEFEGWNSASDGSGEMISNSTENLSGINSDQYYYAQWSLLEYAITYNFSLSEVNDTENPETFTIEDLPYTLNPPTKEGHRFRYWAIDNDLNKRLSNQSISTLGDISLTPVFEPIEEGSPMYTDYCERISRDINGVHYGFLAGNKMYYVAGAGQAEYENITELETIGFTHPMFRDGRARGNGIANAAGGKGHDQWGWEFWRRTKVAYGTIIIDGQQFPHPSPKNLDWRPDKMVVTYEIEGVTIVEEKFISESDVLSTIITSDYPIQVLFEGESYFDASFIPTKDGDPANTPHSVSCSSTVNHNTDENTVVLLENGRAMAKPAWGQPAVEGDMMYSGLNFVFSSNKKLNNFSSATLEEGNIGYQFQLDIPAYEKVALSLAVDEVEENAVDRLTSDLSHIETVKEEKTEWMNHLLNEQIPYFRCSDEDVVSTYYFLWSLYFMYFTDINEGWEQYPHTQTAVNNFMGLHLWDSWAFCAAGSYVADKWAWGNGNALSWKYMVPFKNENNYLPDNFGTHWYSPDTRMNFDGAVGQIWKQYDHSGDQEFLRQVYYDLLRPLYIDNDSKAVGVNEAQELALMAQQLGETADVAHWNTIKEREVNQFVNHHWPWLMGQYETDNWKNNWHVGELRNNALTTEMSRDYIHDIVMDTDVGFVSPNGINTRSADSPPNGIFRASTISCWLGIDGLFRQKADQAGMTVTLNHLEAMTRDYGYPIAPEAWNDKDQAWGSRYYNWDIAIVMPLIEWIGGTNYSFMDSTFTYAPHLPDNWGFVEMNVPVVKEGQTHWVHTKLEKEQVGDHFLMKHSVTGNPLDNTVIAPYSAQRNRINESSSVPEQLNENEEAFYLTTENNLSVTWEVGAKLDTLETLVWVKPRTHEFYQELDVTVDNLRLGTTLRYTTDGSIPTENSLIFPDTLKINETTTFTFKAFGLNTEYSPYTVTYQNIELIADTEITTSISNELNYKLYDLDENVRSLPDFSAMILSESGSIQASDFVWDLNFEAIGKEASEHFGLHLSGLIYLEADNLYEFYLKSDDGSILQIDGQEVIYLNGVSEKDPWFAEGTIGLEAGYHKLDIYYTQYTYRHKLELEYRVLGESNYQSVTEEMFYKFDASEETMVTFMDNGSRYHQAKLDHNALLENDFPIQPLHQFKTFEGWYTLPNCEGTKVSEGKEITSKTTLYSCWIEALAIEKSNVPSWIIYPNPVKEETLKVSLPLEYRDKKVSVHILNMAGQERLNQQVFINNSHLRLAIQDLPKGMYILVINAEGVSETKALKFKKD